MRIDVSSSNSAMAARNAAWLKTGEKTLKRTRGILQNMADTIDKAIIRNSVSWLVVGYAVKYPTVAI